MTTMQMQRNRPSLLPFLLLAAALALGLVWLTLPAPSKHAVAGHGANAWNVTRRFGDADPDDDDTWSSVCADGKRYTIRQLDGNTWDVSIDVPGFNVTRFTCTSRNWVARKLASCDG